MSNLAVISKKNFVDRCFRAEGVLFPLSCLCSDWKVSGDTFSSMEVPISPKDPSAGLRSYNSVPVLL